MVRFPTRAEIRQFPTAEHVLAHVHVQRACVLSTVSFAPLRTSQVDCF